MSAITTTAIFVTKSGGSWTVDVTLLNLSEILPLKDFTVIDVNAQVILNPTYITKTSSTVLTYSGPSIGTAIALEIRRDTPVSSRYYDIPHGSYLNSQALNEEIDRILRKLNEIDDFPGSVLGSYILDQAYSAAWATDNITVRTAKNVYDEMETRAKKNGDTLVSPVLKTATVADPILPASDDNTVASTSWVKSLAYATVASVNAVAAAITALAATPTYRRIGRFTGAGAAVGTLDLSGVSGTIEGERLYYEFKGIFPSDASLFVRPSGLVTPISNPSVISTNLAGNPTYNFPNFGSYVNSFWLGYCENAADSKMWGKGEFQWLFNGGAREIHSVSRSMMHAPSNSYGKVDIFSLGANVNYTTPKTSYTIFATDVATGAVGRNIPTNFTLDVFAYVTP